MAGFSVMAPEANEILGNPKARPAPAMEAALTKFLRLNLVSILCAFCLRYIIE
jgi:hypothetical protein